MASPQSVPQAQTALQVAQQTAVSAWKAGYYSSKPSPTLQDVFSAPVDLLLMDVVQLLAAQLNGQPIDAGVQARILAHATHAAAVTAPPS